ncbi:agmatine deiminase family protein [Streptomyces sp. NPDC002055]|uniref:agmatine deiminase family protein n=1 Tax=Streptomyces sp. NPDC002055 TaxID=3154534 RepID=UPI003325B3AF
MKHLRRRSLMRSGAAALLGGAGLAACASGPEAKAGAQGMSAPRRGAWRMPAESAEHARTFLAWPPRDSVWEQYAEDAQRDVAGIARALADFEPVTLLAAPGELKAARRACGADVEIVPVPVDDLWIRDSGPTFVAGAKGLEAIDFHFNGWGGKQEHRRDARVARGVLQRHRVPRIDAQLTAEGGALEVDGHGTLLATESSLVNANRNPGMSRDAVEAELKRLLGVTEVIWLPGVRGQDITDYHIDALARFCEDGKLLLSRPPENGAAVWKRAYETSRRILEKATDARGRQLEIIDLPEADPSRLGRRGPDFLGGYANYYVANGAVLVPRFGDRKSDRNAASVIGELHPGREVVPVEIPMIAEGGGGIHCSTQQQPAL